MIHIQNVSFTYEQADTPSLKNINLSVKTGECVLLCGKSGCGKTTLIRLLCGCRKTCWQHSYYPNDVRIPWDRFA